jgi:exosortase/archaeosortase family protein
MVNERRTADRDGAKPGGVSQRRAGARFIGVFVGIVLAFYIFSQLGVFTKVVAPASMRFSAVTSEPVIRLVDGDVVRRDTVLSSSRGQVDVHFGCDALEPIVYFAAAVIAFPAAWGRRFIALALGIPALFVLNIARIVSLYFVSTRHPDWFDAAHRDIWQPLFIAATLGLWFAWVMLLPRPRAPRASPEASRSTDG